jgi:6-phosphogluconolactonase
LCPCVPVRCDGRMRTLRYPFLVLAAAVLACAAGKTYFAYVGTYTGHGSRGIYVCRFDPATRALSRAGLAAETENPSFLAIHPNGDYLYAVNETGDGHLSAFRIDHKTGQLTPLNRVSSRGASPCALSVDRTGRYVLAANYGSGSVALFAIKGDGSLAEAAAFDQHKGASADRERQRGPHAHSAVFSPDNRFALSADLGTDRIYVYRFDAARGTLTAAGSVEVPPGSGPRHLAFHPNGRFVYAINELAATVTAFAWDEGTLKQIATVPALPRSYGGPKSGAEIQVHPNGRFVYVSNRGEANDIAIFAIDAASGGLVPVGHATSGGRTPRYFGFDPTAQYVFVANQDSDAVTVFRADPATGRLTATGGTIAIGAPVSVEFAAAE